MHTYKKMRVNRRKTIKRGGAAATERLHSRSHVAVPQGVQGHNVYVVVENGELYPKLYSKYNTAFRAVQRKHADEDIGDEDGSGGVVVENTDTGTTKLYIEKGIHIIIQRYKVKTPK